MTREEALLALASEVAAERLEAARCLQFWAVPADIPALRAAAQQETVAWIGRALALALTRLGDRKVVRVESTDFAQSDGEVSRDVQAVARSRIARTLVHELEPLVGAVQYYASREIHEYERSRTAKHVERLGRLLRAIDALGKVAGAPKLQTVDLGTLAARVVEAHQLAFDVQIQVEGPSTVSLRTDPNLLELILGNALKNACEAVRRDGRLNPTVTVVYGDSDRDAWVAVLDNGAGLPPGATDRLFEVGTSTKDGHLGMGLALTHEAAETLGGSIQLTSDLRGTRFEITVPKGGAGAASSR